MACNGAQQVLAAAVSWGVPEAVKKGLYALYD